MYDATVPNRQNLLYVSLGMRRDQVLALMGQGSYTVYQSKPVIVTVQDSELRDTYLTFRRGFSSIRNPHKSETVFIKERGRAYVIDYYITGCAEDGIEVSEKELTPLVFDNNMLIGWGWEFLSELRGDNNYYDAIVVRGL